MSTDSKWCAALIKYVGMPKAEAKALSMKLGALPEPGPEAKLFLTHQMLASIGITQPGHVARVILASSRAPPPEADYEERRDDDDAIVTELDHDAAAQSAVDPSVVTTHKYAVSGLEWRDIVGQDETSANGLSDAFKASKFLAEVKDLQSWMGQTDTTPVDQIKVDSDKRSPYSVIYAKKPLPYLLKSPNKSRRSGSVVLRICTLGLDPDQQSEEITMTSLTNRLMLFADADTKKIATVHRVDSRTLAHVRSKMEAEVASSAPVAAPTAVVDATDVEAADEFASHLVSIFMCFQSEFLLALDESKTMLDECEQNIMDGRMAKAILARLYHLSRRASVYKRMLELSEHVVRDACDYFDVEGEAACLEPRWEQLRETCDSVLGRSNEGLNLIMALAGYRTSDAVNVLTKISGALTPVSFIAGYYGTNFSTDGGAFPELVWRYSYFVFNLTVITVMVVMMFYLKGKGL